MVALPSCEYLVTHGKSAGFGRFAAAQPVACGRGERVVVRSSRGLELGVVLCGTTPRQARLLGDTPVGELLRPATPDDEAAAALLGALGQRLFADGRRLAAELGIALEVLDVEVLLDGRHAIVQHLSPDHCDPEPFVEALSLCHSLDIRLENLAAPAAPEEDAHGGCGKPDCGRQGDAGCSSCGTGGGCSSCGTGKVDMAAYFTHLRSKMEQQRTSLL